MEPTNGHSCVAIGNYMIRYGGKVTPTTLTGETVAMDLTTNVWRRLVTTGQLPHPRAYHTSVIHGHRMYVFGGLLAVGLDDVHFNMYNVYANSDALSENILSMKPIDRFKLPRDLNKITQQKIEPSPLHCLDLEGQATWTPITVSGPQPPTRAHHAAAVYRNYMFIYGGYSVHTTARPGDDELQAVYTTYSLDLNTMTWRVILPKAHMDSPKLWGMSSALSGNFWILYGGVDIVKCTETAVMAMLNLDDEHGQWTTLELEPRSQKEADEIANCEKAMHTAVRWGDRLMIYGGCSNVASTVHANLYTFDLIKGTLDVSAPTAKTTVLGALEDVKTKKDKKGKKDKKHQEVVPEGVAVVPIGRYSHSALVIANEMYIHGGYNSSQNIGRLGDTWALSFSSSEWRKINDVFDTETIDNIYGYITGTAPPPRPRQYTSPTPTGSPNSASSPNRQVSQVTGAVANSPNMRPHALGISTAMPKNEMDVWNNWKDELLVLQHENDEWQVNSQVDASRLIDTYFLKRDEELAAGQSNGIVSPNRDRARDAIYGGSVMLKKPWLEDPHQRIRIQYPKKQFYVSPSISKLGLEGQLRRQHEKE